jgi:hypothetical protein
MFRLKRQMAATANGGGEKNKIRPGLASEGNEGNE